MVLTTHIRTSRQKRITHRAPRIAVGEWGTDRGRKLHRAERVPVLFAVCSSMRCAPVRLGLPVSGLPYALCPIQ